MKIKQYLVLFALLTSIVIANFSPAESIKIIMTANVNGETDPCG